MFIKNYESFHAFFELANIMSFDIDTVTTQILRKINQFTRLNFINVNSIASDICRLEFII